MSTDKTGHVLSLPSAYLIARSRAHRKRPLPQAAGLNETPQESDSFKTYALDFEDPDNPSSANLSPDVLSYCKKARLLGSNQSPDVLTKGLLEGLVTYTKNDDFVKILLCDPDFPGLLHFLVRLALGSYHPVPQTQESSLNKVISLLDHPEIAPNEWPTDVVTNTPSTLSQPERTPLSDMLRTTESHPEYPVHLLVANILANASRYLPNNHVLLNEEVEKLLTTWCNSPSLHLLLLGAKIRFNLCASQSKSKVPHATDGEKSETCKPVYYPDIFRLDKPIQSGNGDLFQDDYDVDIIFVHGMRGSVFYTWRQNESLIEVNEIGQSTHSKCWPRDWLSSDFPRARVLGIDTSLSPFIWNPICPVDRLKAGSLLLHVTLMTGSSLTRTLAGGS
ncbi:unnamed protein product [Echinostoma caproni]|uniref:Protein SERAC1 n=1 Tax=Echinostoma caproni TaxID=27848 RepID=A0A183AJ28_9TREM|nr:unnamed protein product [Echinostoma caproni]